MKRVHLVWFRNDLRAHDHPALAAIGTGDHAVETLLPLYVWPQRTLGATSFGMPRTGIFRARFLTQTVQSLQSTLEGLGSELLVVTGDPVRIVPALAEAFGATDLWFQDEAGTEEHDETEGITAACAGAVTTHVFRGRTLVHPDDLPVQPDAIPDVFSDFRRSVERSWRIRGMVPTPRRLPSVSPGWGAAWRQLRDRDISVHPGLPDSTSGDGGVDSSPDERAVLSWSGGEEAARKRLSDYIWKTDSLRHYKSTRNGLLGENYSSKLSPWLANGSLSPRLVYEEVRKYERERIRNDSTYWLIFELLWRDYFHFLALKYGGRMFRLEGPRGVHASWSTDRERFESWRSGTTGQAFIDANMRELAATGFMSNRGRQNVASYLVRDMGIDWRMGAEHFESLLLDYDPASNYGNWTYTVGVGTDPREDRYFNADKQASRYDPDGSYRSRWTTLPGSMERQHTFGF